jgi:hypothetical protein
VEQNGWTGSGGKFVVLVLRYGRRYEGCIGGVKGGDWKLLAIKIGR